jgi:hypothetical protein
MTKTEILDRALLVLLVVLIAASFTCTAHAQRGDPSGGTGEYRALHDAPYTPGRLARITGGARRDLALALAKVCVNEAGWEAPGDCALIWQVVESQRANASERLIWLTRHSARVLGGRDCRPGANCRWTRNLAWSDAEPAEWPARERWDPERWARVRLLAWRLVVGEELHRPCEEAPDTWDGRRWRAHALRRGLRPVVCVATRNDGYLYRGAT